jgi:Flp pilus assembly protein TadG
MAKQRDQSRATSEAGTVALEYGLLLPTLIVVFLGSMDVSRLIWTNATLHRAVEAAARCRAVNMCVTDTDAQSKAAAEAWGLAVSPSVFTVLTEAAAVTVTANYDFTVVVPFVGEPSEDEWFVPGTHRITVSARYPMKP